MNYDKKSFLGKLNADIDERLFSSEKFRGDYSDAYNVLVLSAIDSGIGLVKGFKGTTEIPFNYGYSSINRKVVGRGADNQNRKIYFLIAHSTSSSADDGIYELDVNSKTVELVLKGSFLKLNNTMRITGIDIVDGKYLLYTDCTNEPRNVDIARAKNGELTTELQILAIKQPPLKQPVSISPVTDFTFIANNVRGSFFQFKYRYKYKDNTKSTFSPISEVSTMDELFFPEVIRNVGYEQYNAISFNYNIPNSDIIGVEIAARFGNTGDFGIIDYINLSDPTYKKYGVLVKNTNVSGISITFTSGAFTTTQTTIMTSSVEAAAADLAFKLNTSGMISYAQATTIPDTGGIVFTGVDGVDFTITTSSVDYFDEILLQDLVGVGDNYYLFRNSKPLIPIEVRESNLEYDRIPLVALAQRCVNSSNIVYGGITEGYDYPDVNISGSYYYTQPVHGTMSVVVAPAGSNPSGLIYDVTYSGSLLESMVFTISCPNSLGSFTAFYQANSTDTIADVVNALAAQINKAPYAAMVLSSTSLRIFNLNTAPVAAIPTTVFFDSGLKSGDSIRYAIHYQDISGRLSSVVTNASCEINVPFIPENGIPRATLTVLSRPPSWAYRFQILRTKRRRVGYYLQFNVAGVGKSGNLLELNFGNSGSNIPYYNELFGANLSYSFAVGDRIRFIKYASGVYFQEHEDLPILSENEAGSIQIPIPKTFDTSPSALDDLNACQVEVYRPNSFADTSVDSELFYEVALSGIVGDYGLSTRYHISDNQSGLDQNQTSNLSQPLIIYSNEGDVWYKTRRMLDGDHELAGVSILESDYESDQYASVLTSNIGRPNAYDKDAKQIDRKATMYFTESYFTNSNVNNINRVFGTSFKDYDQSYGAIKLLHLDGFELYSFQELRVGKIPILKQMVYNQDGSSNLILSSQLLNQCDYFDYNGGINNNPESFCFNQFNKYFIDIQNNAVCKIGGSGIIRISDIGMVSHFTNIFTEYKNVDLSLTGGQTPRFYGSWDEDNKLVVFCPETITQTLPGPFDPIVTAFDTISFSETQGGWSTKIEFKPSAIIGSFGELISISPSDGKIWSHNTNVIRNLFYGVQRTRAIEVPSCIDVNNSQSFLVLIQEPAILSDDRYDSIAPGSSVDPSIWDIPVISTSLGQESNLLTEDFEKKEGIYFANFYRDTTTPIDDPLLFGDQLKGVWIKVKLTNASTKDIGLNSILIGSIISKRTSV